MKRFLLAVLCLFMTLTMLVSCSEDLIVPTTEETKPSVTTKKKKTVQEEEDELSEQADPKADGEFNVLMIGNSFCYYYPDELYGIAEAAGVTLKICNVYYSGCQLSQHWEWLESNESNYRFVTTDARGRTTRENYSLKRCLNAENWDVISLQQHFDVPDALQGKDACMNKCEPYAGHLVEYLQKRFPLTPLYWHQTWAYQVGYDRSGARVASRADQETMYASIRDVALSLCETYSLTRIPSGDAWQIARSNPAVGDVLCDKTAGEGDFYHDGEFGGGQYLNACVWFEVLTGKSCVGNAYRPDYELSEEKISALQSAAHRAVAAAR